MKLQIPREIYLKSMDTMKKNLDLIGFKFDSKSQDFKYFKSQIMENTYTNLRNLFKFFADKGLIKKCQCGTNLRKGFKKCLCGGSGYINS